MRVLAICNINEEILKKSRMEDLEEVEDETVLDLFRSEFAWMHDSGVSLEQSHEITDDSLTKEYQIFLWRKDKECYVPVGNSMHFESLCRNRLKEAVAKGWIPEYLDPNRFQIMERPVIRAVGPWKAVDNLGGAHS